MKKILFWDTKKLVTLSAVLLLAVFCTIGMSFRPVYDEDEKEIVMSGPRHNHWTWITTSCGSDTYHYKSSIDYAKTTVQTRGNGYVTISTTEIDNVTSPSNGNPRSVTSGSSTGSEASISWNSGLSHDDVEKAQYTDAQIAAAHKKTFTISATSADDENYYFAGWGTSTAESSINNTDNPRTITSDMGITTYTSTSSEPANYKNSNSPYTDNNYYAFFRVREPKNITLKVPSNGTISYSYKNTPTTTPTSETTITTKYDVTLAATPDDGYKFFGWYTLSGTTENYISYISPYTRAYTNDITIYAKFIPATQAVFSIKGTNNYYYDLNRAITEASSSASKTIYPAMDGRLAIGNYTIPSGISLLIPHDITNTVQATPEVVTSATTLSAFRKLTLDPGANITVASGGVLCVGARIMSAGGNKASGYPTGPCGMIDMSQGGHIELNNGSTLYAWGFIKGQDMDQGNNTTGVGTITVNNGATVWEMFAVGDWRGGTACLTIYNNRSSWKFFPFQSYTIQNIEVPTTYNFGATLSNYTNVYGDGHPNGGQFSLIGKSNTLFLMSSGSLVRKWYDPTTDLVCYEMSGTTQLNALNVDVDITTVNSSEYNLPISSSMHIILASSTTISKPMLVQAGAVVEVKSGATLTCSSNVYLFDKDNWGEYCNGKYYYTMTNLSNHKDRGDGKSNAKIDDAKLIIDGSLNITGKMYTTDGGADIMSNGGGTVTFGSLGDAGNIVMCTGVSTNENVARAQANLHNEDDSYTKAIASTTFHNVNGRWFTAAAKDGKADHTYDFTYISSGAVSGTGGTNTTTDAVYSNDKTGLEARMKWFNVTADACANWWHGQGEQAGWFYNWTLNSAWHQFMPTATTDLYSGSNNTLYTKTSCTWEELGSTDVNCLYEIVGVKKALVEGEFIALEPNNNDPAYHAADDASHYYICFAGCNWHEADKYTEVEKAYIIEPDTFIWYNNAWMRVNFEKPFAYTIDETNVPVYYEYVDGEWVLAEPYVRVVDGIEDRSYWFFEDAFKFANSVLRSEPTITILRDVSATTAAWSYTATNKECTLDLHGQKLTLTVTGSGTSEIKMFNISASGTKFTITDSSDGAKGELRLIAAPNTAKQSKRWHGVYLTNGELVLNAGKVYAEDNFKYTSTSDAGMVSGVTIAAGKTFTMNNGTIEAYSKYNAIGVQVVGAAGVDATVKIKGGTIHAETTQVTSAYGMYIAGGTTTITGGKIEARTMTTTAIGVATIANASGYYGTLEMKGGEIDALATTSTAYGVQVGEAVIYSSGNIISDRVVSKATISKGTIRATTTKTESSSLTIGVRSFGTTEITGGTIEAIGTQSYAYGVYAVSGTTTISGTPTIIARAPTVACGACAGLTPANKTGVPYNGHLEISGGRFEVSATTSTYAYGVLVEALGRAVNYSTKSGYYPGNYVSAGSATISGGEFDVQAHTTSAYGIYVKGAFTQTGAKLDADGNLADPVTSAPPTCTVSGGKFKMSGTGDVYATNDAADAANYHINGGYYSHDNNIAGYVASPKHVVTLPEDDANRPDYSYKVADAYLVTFLNKDGTGDPLQSTYQEPGKAPIYTGETPTLASTTTESYIFDGWATEPNGAKVYDKDATLPNVTSAGATYYAHYETTALKYIVSFDATTNGGTCDGDDKKYVDPSTAVGALPTASRTGYTFNGWYTAASGGTKLTTSTTISADVTYYAQFTVKTYTLTWELGVGTVSTEGKYGSTKWPAKKATGTQSKAISYGVTLTAPVVTRTGYTFSRWEPLVAATMPAEAVTYTAIWTPKTNTAYTVKHYLLNVDGTCPEEAYETEAFTGTTASEVTPAVKSYDGFVSPATQTATIAADGSLVVEYQYARKHYTFTLDANGGTSEVPSIEVIHGATIGAVPPDAQKGCNDFVGWFTKPEGGVKITSDFVIEYDMKTLYAQFSDDVRTYPITYLAGANGTGTVDAGTKTCGVDAVLASATFTRTGYTQTGWSTIDGGEKVYDLGGAYTANAAITMYPFWTINQYTISFNSAGGSAVASITQDYNTAVTAPANPTKTGYTFAGWDPAVPNPMPAEDMECVAQWTANNYTITYKDQGDAAFSGVHGDGYPTTHTYGTATALVNPTKTGYTFGGWYDNAGCTGEALMEIGGTAYTEDFTLYAKWTANTYEVTLNPNSGSGGSASVTMTYNSSEHTAITNPTRTGYTFHSWNTTTSSSTRKIVISSKGVMSENVAGYTGAGGVWIRTTATTLYARWTANTYTGTNKLKKNGGNKDGSYTVKYAATSLTVTTAPSRTGYMVEGYYKEAECTTLVATPAGALQASTGYTNSSKKWNQTSAKDLYTKWTPIAYSVRFNKNDEDATGTMSDQDFTYDEAQTLTVNGFSKTGYTFVGWATEPSGDVVYSNSQSVNNLSATHDAVVDLYARWTAATYDVTLNSNGGTINAGNVENYTYGMGATLPTNVTRTGYDFGGWYDNSSFEGDAVTAISTSDTGAKEYWAQWTANTNTPYVVKHYQQNLDDTYPEEPTDTDNETGTTDTEVTPAVKNYTGFTAPDAQTVTVSADGSRVVTYQYTRNSYNLTWDANGGELSGTYTSGSVKFGATINVPTASRANYDFDGWDEEPAATMPAEDKTYTAQWSLSAVTILWKSEDGSETLETDDAVLIGTTPSFDGTAPTKATTAEYTYTFDGWTTEANGEGTFYAIGELPTVSAAATYYAHFTATANVASVKVGSTTTYYADFADAWDATNSATGTVTLKLLQTVEDIAASLAYTNAQNCTLDLNNHTLAGTVTKLIDINATGKTFTIDDSSAEKEGKISMITSANARVYGLFITAGTVHLKHGTIYAKNTHTYSSATANKNTAATAVYVTKAQTFKMDDGTVESEAQRASYAILADKAGTATITIGGGLVKGHTNKSTTAAGIYTYAKGLTVNGGRVVGHAYTTTAYGIFLYGGSATLNGGTIEATNDTTNSAGTTTTYGVYVRYSSGSYKGVLTVPSTSTVKVLAKSRTTTACAVYVYPSSTASTIAGGTFTAIAKTSTTARGIWSDGTITVSGGVFDVYAASTTSTITTVPCGIYATRGTVTVNGSPIFNVTSGASRAYGAFAYGTIGAKGTGKYSGTIKIDGGTFNVTTTTTTAYGAYAGLLGKKVSVKDPENPGDTIAGQHYMPGIIEITDGTFNVKATTNTAYGIVVAAANTESGAVGTTVRIPTMTVTGGKFKITSKGDASKAYAMNNAADNTALVVEGGFYSTKKMNSGNIEDKYTAPTKDCNYYVQPLADATYKWQVSEVANTGFYADIVDVDNTDSKLILNVTSWAVNGWPYTINGTAYEKTAREADRTLKIPYIGEPGDNFAIKVQKSDETTVSHRIYVIPQEVTSATTLTANHTKNIFVNNGATLTVTANVTVKNIYVAPGSKLLVNSGKTLTADTIFLRTTWEQAAELENNGTIAPSTKVVYTRIIKDKDFHLFGLPLSCPVSSVRLSDGVVPPYTTGWVLRSYDEERRSNYGADDNNWTTLSAEGTIAGGAGYELFSASNYYREFYFPVNLAELTNQVAVTYHLGEKGEKQAGWNAITSPFTKTYANTKVPEGLVVNWYQDGYNFYTQEIPTSIPPAYPFAIQATKNGYISFEGTSITALMPRRRAAAQEAVQIQWIELEMTDMNNLSDQTSVYSHPNRYDAVYQTGIDVAKRSLTASRAIIYSSHVYGDMAFAGVADSLLEQGVALTVYSPKPQELTISMRDNAWLERLAEVWLIDVETGARTDLFWSDYTFEANEGTTRGRLFLQGRFKAPQIATDLEDVQTDNVQGTKAEKLMIHDKLYIRINGQLYDATGKQVKGK